MKAISAPTSIENTQKNTGKYVDSGNFKPVKQGNQPAGRAGLNFTITQSLHRSG
jgi:hypothetical protein